MPEASTSILGQIAANAGESPDHLARTGDAHFTQGRFQEALLCYHALTIQEPKVAEHQYRMGLACSRLGQTDAASFSLMQAILLKPDFAEAYGALSRLRLAAGKIAEALRHARRAADLSPNDVELAVGLASMLEASRDTQAACDIVDRLLAAGRETPSVAILYSRLASRRKQEPEALAVTLRLLEKNESSFSAAERSSLHFAAAQLLDLMGRYEEAFAHATLAHAPYAGKYPADDVEQQVRLWTNYFTPRTLQRLPRATHGSRIPVFIVGMPRSGTTLVEQILSSHPAVHGAGELNWIETLWQSAMLRHGGAVTSVTECLDLLTVADANALAAEYLKPLQALGPMALRITDKMPLNFMHLGLIALLFPQARIIHCRRDPFDTCLSCFMTDFANINYGSLAAFGHFHRQCNLMMAHWKSVLSLPILEVDYEQMVGDVEGQTRRLIQFVDLPWNARCLRFHENKRLVATASQSQVRRPIYQDSLERWRHYEKYLGPLWSAFAGETQPPSHSG